MFGIESRTDEFYKHRKLDNRILCVILKTLDLPQGNKVADIGAGYGKYSNALARKGYEVFAIEPSIEMRNKSIQEKNVTWLQAQADRIPLEDKTVDASILILSIHHFTNLSLCINEIDRITQKRIVIMTFDPDIYTSFWLFDYIPELRTYYRNCLLNIVKLKELLSDICNRNAKEIIFKIPEDCQDLFSASCWKRPDLFLVSEIRKSMSPFSYIDEQTINCGLKKLKSDIDGKSFFVKYRDFLHDDEKDLGCRFIVV